MSKYDWYEFHVCHYWIIIQNQQSSFEYCSWLQKSYQLVLQIKVRSKFVVGYYRHKWNSSTQVGETLYAVERSLLLSTIAWYTATTPLFILQLLSICITCSSQYMFLSVFSFRLLNLSPSVCLMVSVTFLQNWFWKATGPLLKGNRRLERNTGRSRWEVWEYWRRIT